MGLAGLLIAALLGYCGVRLWLPRDSGRSPWTPVLHASLGIGLGIGSTSCLYFLLLAGGAASLSVIAGCEMVALCAAGALVLRQRTASPPGGSPTPSPSFSWNWLTALGLAAMLAIFLASFANISGLNPQGDWDAFAIWNLRARFLIHTGTWKYAVTALPMGTHMEYPLLLPGVVARGWIYAGSPAPMVPIAAALVFAVALAILLVSALALARGASIGLLAGVVLLANPSFVKQAPSQYADVPLAFFFLAALALIVLGGQSARPARCVSLAGVFAGFAAWTKNEGSLLLVALAAALLVSAWRSAGWRSAARQSGIFLLGTLPGLLLVLWFKAALAPPDPLAAQMTVNLGHDLANAGRWLQVAGGFLKQAWELYVFPGPSLALLAVTCGLLRLGPRNSLSPAPLLAVLIVLAGYFAIFLVTTYDLEWLFGSALDRLYMHVWPALVLAVFLLLRRPEDFAIVSSPAKPKRKR